MREELKVVARITGYVDGYINREEVIQEYYNQLKLAPRMPWRSTQTDIVEMVAYKLLDNVAYNTVDGIVEIDDTDWWDKDEVVDFINECIDSINEYQEEPDGQLVLFDPTPYEKSSVEIDLEKYNRLAELKKQTENGK